MHFWAEFDECAMVREIIGDGVESVDFCEEFVCGDDIEGLKLKIVWRAIQRLHDRLLEGWYTSHQRVIAITRSRRLQYLWQCGRWHEALAFETDEKSIPYEMASTNIWAQVYLVRNEGLLRARYASDVKEAMRLTGFDGVDGIRHIGSILKPVTPEGLTAHVLRELVVRDEGVRAWCKYAREMALRFPNDLEGRLKGEV